MKFNEKLAKLRRDGGLTKEDLAYQFGVTSEMISKWESGEIIPEYNKLEEMSRFFNLSVEELKGNEIPEKNNVIMEENSKNKTNNKKIVIIIIVIIVIIFILSKTFTSFVFDIIKTTLGNITNEFENVNNQAEDVFDIFNDIANQTNNQIENIIKENEITEEVKDKFYNEVQNSIDKAKNEVDTKAFNGTYELYEGIISGVRVRSLLSDVVVNNRKESKILTVIFENENTTDIETIKNIRERIDKFSEYEVYFDYDEEGYINRVNIINS